MKSFNRNPGNRVNVKQSKNKQAMSTLETIPTPISDSGFTFRKCNSLSDSNELVIEARGNTYRDDYGDERPEKRLVTAAENIAARLTAGGFKATVNTSEKGWVLIWIRVK